MTEFVNLLNKPWIEFTLLDSLVVISALVIIYMVASFVVRKLR